MKYEGPLYGKIGRRYIPLRQTSDDVDAMEQALAAAKVKHELMQVELKQLRHDLRFNPLQLKTHPTT